MTKAEAAYMLESLTKDIKGELADAIRIAVDALKEQIKEENDVGD